MKDIQIVWDDNFGSVLQLKINNPICSERFNEIIKYLQAIEIHNNAEAHVFFIQDKYIFVFYEELIESEKTFLNKIKNHFRTCKNSLHIDDYKLDILTTEDAANSFNDWLMKLIVKTKDGETVISKSSIVANDYIRDFNELNYDKIGKLKIEKEIVKIDNETKQILIKNDIIENEIIEQIVTNSEIKTNISQIDEQSKELDQMVIDAINRKNDMLKKENDNKIKLQKEKQNGDKLKEIEQIKLQELKQKQEMTYKTIVNQLFTITNNKRDFVSKKVFCDLLNLDITNKSDIRLLTTVLKNEGVEYNRKKSIKGVAGAYCGIELNE